MTTLEKVMLVDCTDHKSRIKLLTLALEAAREALWCLDHVDDIEVWRTCVRNVAITEITCILDGEVLKASELPAWTPGDRKTARGKAERIEELKRKLGMPSSQETRWSPSS